MPTQGASQTGGHVSLAESTYAWFADWGAVAVGTLCTVGDVSLFAARTVGWLIAKRPRKESLLLSFYQVGVLSLPVVALTGTFIGMVLAVQSYYQFRQIGLESRLGAVINMSLVRELGPVLAATMLAGRVGSAMAAELGTMRVTEQIDALAAMGANPIQHLVVPRLMACVILIPMLTVMADFMGVLGGYFFSDFVLQIDRHFYWENSSGFVGMWDFFHGLIKSVFFGATIALISCHRGFTATAGAEGVGKAATAAFVYSFCTILALDLWLGIVMDRLYFAIWDKGASLY
ncbi:MAG: ABC transporter permease [Planctomycetales bacterium]|nr:ABC transporter permease [Planctomycetales bacterium]